MLFSSFFKECLSFPYSLVTAAKSSHYGNGYANSAQIPAAKLASVMRFDAIIVDEAGQCTEPEILIPLRLAYAGYVLPTQNSQPSDKSHSILGLPVQIERKAVGCDASVSGFSWTSVPPWAVRSSCCRLVLVGDPLQVRGLCHITSCYCTFESLLESLYFVTIF